VDGAADLRLAEELGRRAALSIENARLYRAAGRATQTRDEVLGIVAHDLRNPLNLIFGHLYLLEHAEGDTEAEREESVKAIQQAATQMSRLIQDLLDVTAMEAGRLSVDKARVATRQVVYDSMEAQKPLALSASVELRQDLADNLPDLWADSTRLRQIFANLIGNAIKFTAPGGVIVVGAAPGDGEVLLWVNDTGSGIAAEDLPHLFDRFWQARKAHGFGLGLPIVKGLVEAHRGRVWVRSTPGQGTTFFFTIPIAACQQT
jgi:signal transduction histidine kinase